MQQHTHSRDSPNTHRTHFGKFWIENEIIDKYMTLISGNPWTVLTVVARHYNKTGQCNPSIRRIAKLTGLHHETVSLCVKKLIALGFFEQTQIRERFKLRTTFTKTAHKLLLLEANLLEIPDTKEEKENKGHDDTKTVEEESAASKDRPPANIKEIMNKTKEETIARIKKERAS
jgi:DNA-binding transcriptional regulator YhcF (GntR family)